MFLHLCKTRSSLFLFVSPNCNEMIPCNDDTSNKFYLLSITIFSHVHSHSLQCCQFSQLRHKTDYRLFCIMVISIINGRILNILKIEIRYNQQKVSFNEFWPCNSYNFIQLLRKFPNMFYIMRRRSNKKWPGCYLYYGMLGLLFYGRLITDIIIVSLRLKIEMSRHLTKIQSRIDTLKDE